ncbi:MAG: EamA family transporter [Candidatus Cloacimonadales bacterium]
MIYLWIVSVIWAFSFGLIKGQLAGLDPALVATIRLGLAFLTFLPFLRLSGLNRKLAGKLIASGMLQFGLMYIAYISAFRYLPAWQIAIFTVFTPLYIGLIDDLLQKKFRPWLAGVVLLAVVGALILLFRQAAWQFVLRGFLLVQISNLAFAGGQVWYKNLMQKSNKNPLQTFALVYAGAVLLSATAALFSTRGQVIEISGSQWLTLLYLGVIASGACFFLWNLGALKTSTGQLAIMNNMKIPTATAVSLIFFAESAELWRLLLGSGIMLLALWLQAQTDSKPVPSKTRKPIMT